MVQRKKLSQQVSNIQVKDFCEARTPWKDYPDYSSGSMSKDRRLAGFGLDLCRKFNSGSARDVQRLAAFVHLSRILDIIYTGPTHLFQKAHKLQDSIDALLAHVTFLSWEAKERDTWVYRITPKFHYLWHMGQEAEFINPFVSGCCLKDEDFQGKMASIGSGCTRGTSNLKLSASIMGKYVRAMAARWRSRQSTDV